MGKSITEAVEETLTPEAFDLISFLDNGGVTLPTDEVTIYNDLATWHDIKRLDIKRDALIQEHKNVVGGVPEDEMAPLDEERGRLAAKHYDSRMIFHLQAVAPTLWDAIMKKSIAMNHKRKPEDEGEDPQSWANTEMQRMSIRKIEIPAKNQVIEAQPNQGILPHTAFVKMASKLIPNEWERVTNACVVLLFSPAMSDMRADAGFPGGSADVGSAHESVHDVEGGN